MKSNKLDQLINWCDYVWIGSIRIMITILSWV